MFIKGSSSIDECTFIKGPSSVDECTRFLLNSILLLPCFIIIHTKSNLSSVHYDMLAHLVLVKSSDKLFLTEFGQHWVN